VEVVNNHSKVQKPMIPNCCAILRIALTLLCFGSMLGFVPVTLAQQQPKDTPVSVGVVVTVTAIDAKTGMAILKTDAGEAFELWKERLWKVGDKVLCDRIIAARPPLQNCRRW
jgi:hypothetical protein